MRDEEDAMVDLWQSPRADQWGPRAWGAPERVSSGYTRRCWGNARRAVATDPGLAYAEGLVWRDGRVAELHGWCLDRATGGAVEVTGPVYADAVAYRGLALSMTAVDDFLDRGGRRGRWGLVSLLGEVFAEPPSVLFILVNEMGRGIRTDAATWAAWRDVRRS